MGRLEKSNMSTIGENIGPLSPAATYGDLLNLNNNGQGLINTPVQVQDGYGNLTNIFMSLVATNFDRSVSELQLDGIALTASATTLNNISFAVDAPYIVASSYPSLPNSVILAAGSGISLTAGGGNYTIAASGESAGLNSLTTTGIVVRTGTATYNTASITSNNGTITVTNGSAVSGNPDLAVVPSTTVQNVNVLSNGVQTSTRSSLNFIPSTGISISVVDNSGSGQTDITFSSSGSGGTVTSVSGTTNRITVTNGTTTPVIDISASYVGQSSITTLGTISTGTWQGTAVTVPYGGTGDTSFTAYSVLCGGTTSTAALQNVSGVGTSGQVLTSNGAGALPTWQAAGSGTVTSVSGTSGQIDVATGTTTPVISISASYVGQSSITTLGTITTGTWHGTAVGVIYGGTGDTSFTAYSVLCGGTTSTAALQNVSGVGTSGQVLTSNGASALPTWQAGGSGTVTSVTGVTNRITVANSTTTPLIDISAAYVGQTSIITLGTVTTGTWNASVIALAYGGTNANLTASNGGIFYSTASAGAILAGTATANQILLSGVSTTPAWSTATYPATTTINQLLYSSSANTIAGLATANSGVLITSSGGVPSISSTLPTAVQTNITQLGTITVGTWNGTTIDVPYGGTGNTTFTAYSLITAGTTSTGAFQNVSGVGTSGQILTSNGASALPSWKSISSDLSLTINQSSHGLSAGNVIKCTGSNTFATAKADSAADAEVIGIVSSVIDSNNFIFQYAGVISGLTVTAGTVYFLDPSTAGAITATAPSTSGQVVKPLLIAMTSTTGLWMNQRGEVL